jgi:hypothetical protein
MGEGGDFVRKAYTGVSEHDKILTRLHEIAIVGRERLLACQPKLVRRRAHFFNLLQRIILRGLIHALTLR